MRGRSQGFGVEKGRRGRRGRALSTCPSWVRRHGIASDRRWRDGRIVGFVGVAWHSGGALRTGGARGEPGRSERIREMQRQIETLEVCPPGERRAGDRARLTPLFPAAPGAAARSQDGPTPPTVRAESPGGGPAPPARCCPGAGTGPSPGGSLWPWSNGLGRGGRWSPA